MIAYIGNDYYEKKGATGTFVVGFSGSSVTAGHGTYVFHALSRPISFLIIIFSCMYACICVCMYACMHVYIYVCVCMYLCTCAYAYVLISVTNK